MAQYAKPKRANVTIKKTDSSIVIKPKSKKEQRKLKRKATVKRVIGKVAGATILLPLQPFKPAIKKDLDSKGYATKGMSFPYLIEAFFNENISKKKDKTSSFEPLERGYIADSYLMQLPSEHFNENDSLAADALKIIVQETVKFFKGRKDKKAAAKAEGNDPKRVMSESDLRLANEAEKVQKDLEDKAAAEKAVSTGSMKNIIKYGLIVAVIGFAVYYFSKRK